MSLNKVLNRPMFRKEALRKGVLKTINANVGIMVGQLMRTRSLRHQSVPGQGIQ